MNIESMLKGTPGLAAIAGVSLVALSACAPNDTVRSNPSAQVDGSVPVPAGYRQWAHFVPTVDKDQAGQVREIYINDTGLKATSGEAFPSGTVSVMEIYSARKNASGALVRNADGRLVKGDLSKIFVMAKGKGWGAAQPAGTIDNGDWVYAAYQADATTQATNDFAACRGCHAPLKEHDYVARYPEHFAAR
ncbi:MAG: cytochrome P460 family protein [Gammaproteobacteria bacterium]|nr:cytochrome P460 family protein [Gammaproteobacteria bacterium]